MTLHDELSSQVRLAILQACEAMPARALHEYVLLERIAALGLGTTTDTLHIELAWLRNEARLLTLDEVAFATVARLTPRGVEVALGRAICPGVARPRS